MNTIPAKPLPLTGAFNVRDLGGYAAAGGQTTRFHRFLRAAELRRLTEDDQNFLIQYGVRAIFDLRSVPEAEESPDPILPGVTHYAFPLLDHLNSAQTRKELPDSMAEVYIALLQDNGETFAAMLRQMLKTDGCILFHCSAGKDRTGLTAMLLLGAAGVPKETILQDYEVSEKYLAPVIAKILPILQEKGIPSHLLSSQRANMEAALEWIGKNAGSIPLYLNRIGLSDDEIKALADKLLHP